MIVFLFSSIGILCMKLSLKGCYTDDDDDIFYIGVQLIAENEQHCMTRLILEGISDNHCMVRNGYLNTK